jgi:DNA mismatch repair protein MutS
MRFDIDKQTINDLELFDKVKGEKSVFSLFNFTKSIGGYKRLESMFFNPLTDIELIEKRVNNIKCCWDSNKDFDFDKENLDFIEHYLTQQNVPDKFSIVGSFLNALNYRIKPKNEYYIVQRGIRLLIGWLNEIYDYLAISKQDDLDFIRNCKLIVFDKIDNTSLSVVLKLKGRVKLYPNEYGKLDYCFRNLEVKNIRDILEVIYEIDAFKSVAFAANKYGFTFPILTNKLNCFQVQGLFHPFLDNPVTNDFEFSSGKNVCFLTGPNMAGKSTFLKSISISIYLSHLGFPVPAKYMETSIFNGLLTTINLSDNINKGYSHFYNEVLRIKYIAERINEIGNIFVVFDELFRGTNVKDAYEASLSVITAFSKLNKGAFAISTHIIEIADKLNNNESIFFKYFEANLVNETPQYNYKLKDGVTDERIGMYILNKEKVIETIENAINKMHRR